MAAIFSKQKRSSILDLKILEPPAIIDEISREFAFGMLELNLLNPAVDKLSLVEELCNTPHLIEFVISGTSSPLTVELHLTPHARDTSNRIPGPHRLDFPMRSR